MNWPLARYLSKGDQVCGGQTKLGARRLCCARAADRHVGGNGIDGKRGRISEAETPKASAMTAPLGGAAAAVRSGGHIRRRNSRSAGGQPRHAKTPVLPHAWNVPPLQAQVGTTERDLKVSGDGPCDPCDEEHTIGKRGGRALAEFRVRSTRHRSTSRRIDTNVRPAISVMSSAVRHEARPARSERRNISSLWTPGDSAGSI